MCDCHRYFGGGDERSGGSGDEGAQTGDAREGEEAEGGGFTFGGRVGDDDDSDWFRDMGMGLHVRRESGLNLDGAFMGGGRAQADAGVNGAAKGARGGGGGGGVGTDFGDFGLGLDDSDIGLDVFSVGGGAGHEGSFVRHALKTEQNMVRAAWIAR